jgi:hypothetical protein
MYEITTKTGTKLSSDKKEIRISKFDGSYIKEFSEHFFVNEIKVKHWHYDYNENDKEETLIITW